eukprot:COSAG02_NODE_2635_length_8365_cov_2.690056_1_plen_172_part_10
MLKECNRLLTFQTETIAIEVFQHSLVQSYELRAEAWQLDDDIESRIRRWNAYNLATITTGGTAPGEGNQRWVQRLKQQQIAPAYNLIGILRARRKKWLGEILCQQDDSLTRIEVLRLAFAVTLGVMEVRGTILEHAPDFSSPADLIRKVGRARPEATLRHYTATERAYAETK